jgi:glutamate-5-semialdehyde dehydrogenase
VSAPTHDDRTAVLDVARRGREAAVTLRALPRATKDAALLAMADALDGATARIVDANLRDVERANASGTDPAIVDRLTLTPDRLRAIADAVRDVAALPDPVGEVVRGYTLPNGLTVRQVRVPLGVLVEVMRETLEEQGLPVDSIALVPGTSHESVKHLMTARGLVDVLIPRGGEALIRSVVEGSTVPVIETGVGNCHVYVDAAADLDMALAIVLNAKTDRTSVCNAAESLLVHAAVAEAFLPLVVKALQDAGVTVHGDPAFTAYDGVVAADDEDFAREYLGLEISAAVVPDLDAALEHVRRFSTGHTEAIVTRDQQAARRFVAEVDAAAVVVNASTRFTDGGEFGFGAEIGISTQKLHARGPMGLPEMTSTKYVVTGDGQVR